MKNTNSPVSNTQMGCGVLLAIFIVVLFVAYCKDEHRNTELGTTKDPARIAYLNLDYVDEGTKSSVTKTGDHVTVEFRIDPWTLTGGTARSHFLNSAKGLFRDYFSRLPDVHRVTIVGTGSFTNIKGNESRGKALEIELTREAASDIQWDKVNSDNLPRIANKFWQHPSFD